ncbi:MAG: hypothetical protein AAGA56_04980, partial [Myxococcota bacterium]
VRESLADELVAEDNELRRPILTKANNMRIAHDVRNNDAARTDSPVPGRKRVQPIVSPDLRDFKVEEHVGIGVKENHGGEFVQVFRRGKWTFGELVEVTQLNEVAGQDVRVETHPGERR